MILTPDQSLALDQIIAAQRPGARHLLTGYAGTGKTTLMQHVARTFSEHGLRLSLTAPTHKAVSVLSRKLAEAGLDGFECCTIHSKLGLKARHNKDRLEFYRPWDADPITDDVVIIDECSMIDSDLFEHIEENLPSAFVLFVGDPAQLPPVNEKASRSFGVKSRSHLETIVRQSEGNPVLDAATAIRQMQGSDTHWDWCKEMRADQCGVFVPAIHADRWLEKAFTSPDFEEDSERFRYLAWTNARVAQVNAKIRRWRYGDALRTDLPFMPGEMVLLRDPVFLGDFQVFRTNDEARALDVAESGVLLKFGECGDLEAWTASIPTWRVTLDRGNNLTIDVHIPRNRNMLRPIVKRIKQEASEEETRWEELHLVRRTFPVMQAIYALTVHNSQGSTFRNAFIDIRDIQRRERTNLLEFQQLLYVAATRPSHCLIIIGEP